MRYLSSDRSSTPPAAAFGRENARPAHWRLASRFGCGAAAEGAGPKPERVVSGFHQATAAGKIDAAKIRARRKRLLAALDGRA